MVLHSVEARHADVQLESHIVMGIKYSKIYSKMVFLIVQDVWGGWGAF